MGNPTMQIFYRNKKGKYVVLKQIFSVEPFSRQLDTVFLPKKLIN